MRLLLVCLVSAAIMLEPISSGCRGSDNVVDSTNTSAPAVAETRTLPSTSEPPRTPEPTALAATSTPAASPTPAELKFTAPNGGDRTETAPSTGPLGIKFTEAESGYDPAANRMQAAATIYVGINERPSASAWLYNDFFVPGEGSTPVTAQISTDVNSKGVLAGNGAAGTGAAVTITLSVLEAGRTIASEVVHTLEHREKVLTGGGFDDIASSPADMQVLLVPGRRYQLRLTVTCAASSGLVGASTYCAFGPSEVFEEGFVHWGARSILLAP